MATITARVTILLLYATCILQHSKHYSCSYYKLIVWPYPDPDHGWWPNSQILPSMIFGFLLQSRFQYLVKTLGLVQLHLQGVASVCRFFLEMYFGELHAFCTHDTHSKDASNQYSEVEKLPPFVKLVSVFGSPTSQHSWLGLVFFLDLTPLPLESVLCMVMVKMAAISFLNKETGLTKEEAPQKSQKQKNKTKKKLFVATVPSTKYYHTDSIFLRPLGAPKSPPSP